MFKSVLGAEFTFGIIGELRVVSVVVDSRDISVGGSIGGLGVGFVLIFFFDFG